jgi:tetratricopeptide (TPR) repeat protein
LQIGTAIALRKGDINEAIKHYEQALQVLTMDKDPEEWALAKRAAGEAYYLRGSSDLRKALEYYREALTVFTPEQYPDEGLLEAIEMMQMSLPGNSIKKKRMAS